MTRMRLAFVKFAGMSTGGTERWLQNLAASLPPDRFEVTYFWSDPAPILGSSATLPPASPDRLAMLEERGVTTVRFHVGAVDGQRRRAPWVDTDFWDVFDPDAFDLVQTAKLGPAEYPYDRLGVPVCEMVAYQGGVDWTRGIVRSLHWSEWSRSFWWRGGGVLEKSDVVPMPVPAPASHDDLRAELGIGDGELVVGMHQRPDDGICSPIPLEAIASVARDVPVRALLLGGSPQYAAHAERLGLGSFVQLPATGDAGRISRFLNTLDVYTHGRRDGETFGLAIAEAMSHGLPCLSHRVPGNANAQSETIGSAGYVANDASDYAAVLDLLVRDADRRALLSGRARVESERFSAECTVDVMATHYERMHRGEPVHRRRSRAECLGGVLVEGDVLDPHDVASDSLTGVSRYEAILEVLGHLRRVSAPATLAVDGSLAVVAIAALRRGLFSTVMAVGSVEDVERIAILNGVDHRLVVVDRWAAVPADAVVVCDQLTGTLDRRSVETFVVGTTPPDADLAVRLLDDLHCWVGGQSDRDVHAVLDKAARRSRHRRRAVEWRRRIGRAEQSVRQVARRSRARLRHRRATRMSNAEPDSRRPGGSSRQGGRGA